MNIETELKTIRKEIIKEGKRGDCADECLACRASANKIIEHIRRLLEEQEDLWNEKLQEHKERIQRIGRDKDINSYASGYYEGGMEAIGYLTPDTEKIEVDTHL